MKEHWQHIERASRQKDFLFWSVFIVKTEDQQRGENKTHASNKFAEHERNSAHPNKTIEGASFTSVQQSINRDE
jgi:hypothetical protein